MGHHHEDGLGPPVTSGLGGAVILTWSHHLETSMKHVFTSKLIYTFILTWAEMYLIHQRLCK